MSDAGHGASFLEAHPAARMERRTALWRAPLAAASLLGLIVDGPIVRAQPAATDSDLGNFLLNLSYLEAQYHACATTGAGLPSSLLSGGGNPGTANGARQVTFTDPALAAYAREIAADKRAQVEWLRILVGTGVVAQPDIDLGAAASGGFSTLARLAGIDSAGIFDPYASENDYLIGAFIFADLAVTACRGVLNLAREGPAIEAFAAALATQAYHAAALRALLLSKGIITFRLVDATEKLSAARDNLDGPDDIDQGIRTVGGSPNDESNIVPADARGIPFSRTPGQVLNLLYLTHNQAAGGGFFPSGANGFFNMSASS